MRRFTTLRDGTNIWIMGRLSHLPQEADRLIAAARQVLRDSKGFQAFMKLSRGNN